MTKSIFNLYLQKAASGDHSALAKLIERLADRLILVPTAAPADSEGEVSKVKVLRIIESDRFMIPVFSSVQILKDWCEKNAHSVEFISILGADFCAALEEGEWLSVDPGSTTQLELDPERVKEIASSEVKDAE